MMKISVIVPSKNEPRAKEVVSVLKEILSPIDEIILLQDSKGKGKGWAVRKGRKKATGDIICYIDGDMEIEPRQITKLTDAIIKNECDVAVGHKAPSGSIYRKIITIVSRLFIRILFGLNIDTQTGIKAFRKYHLPEWQEDSFAFDIEILAKARRQFSRIKEIPVEVNMTKSMSSKSIINFIIGAFKIKYRLMRTE